MQLNCPAVQPFHFTATGVDQTSLALVILENDPQKALAKVLAELPTNWIGGVEVADDDTQLGRVICHLSTIGRTARYLLRDHFPPPELVIKPSALHFVLAQLNR